MSAATAAARRPATFAGREHFGQGLRAAGPPSTAMKPYPLSPFNHFTVPCAILTFLVVDAAPAMAGGPHSPRLPLASLSRNARGVVDRATGRLPGDWNFPARPASAAGAN